MKLVNRIEKIFMMAVDRFYEKWPQPVPNEKRLRRCKIISHRGEYDNLKVIENTIPAFDMAVNANLWGLEFDIRWTKDLNPIVFHDKDLFRIFKSTICINQLNLDELKKRYPLIPTLSQVLQRYAKKIHLMVEIKEEHYPDPIYQNRVLHQLFSPLKSQVDFHFLSFNPDIFKTIAFAPSLTFLPIARTNVRDFSKMAIENKYGGITGQYLLMQKRYIEKHQKKFQQVGTGIINSKNSFFREIGRGIDWIFSNRAMKLQKIRDKLLNERRLQCGLPVVNRADIHMYKI